MAFHGAQHVLIEGSTFNDVQGNQDNTINNHTHNANTFQPSRHLRPVISGRSGAFDYVHGDYNSAVYTVYTNHYTNHTNYLPPPAPAPSEQPRLTLPNHVHFTSNEDSTFDDIHRDRSNTIWVNHASNLQPLASTPSESSWPMSSNSVYYISNEDSTLNGAQFLAFTSSGPPWLVSSNHMHYISNRDGTSGGVRRGYSNAIDTNHTSNVQSLASTPSQFLWSMPSNHVRSHVRYISNEGGTVNNVNWAHNNVGFNDRTSNIQPLASVNQPPLPMSFNHHTRNSGNTFNNVRGDQLNAIIHNIQNTAGWGPQKLLFDTAATGALHNSDEGSRTACHPDTRVRVLRDIAAWTEGSEKLLWLCGAAGAGKSAIAQTVAERCTEEGKLVASFFFLREDPKRGHAKHFWATLAVQIYILIPELRWLLLQVIENDPLIFDRSRKDQFQKLIAEPLQTLATSTNVLVIIDGLDECKGLNTQNEIIFLINETLRISPTFPARFLVASRLEPNIQKTFDHADFHGIARQIILDDSDDAHCDIRVYLQSEFGKICASHEATSPSRVPRPWPSDELIDLLVSRSSGQFIYASTVIKFVGGADFHPEMRLQAIIDNSDSRALSELDKLYTQILSTCHPNNAGLLRTILALILVVEWPTVKRLDTLLELQPGYSRLVLRGLHSLLSIGPPDRFGDLPPIEMLHKSFSDFLQDQSRSQGFYVNIRKIHRWLALRCMKWILVQQDDFLCQREDDRCVYAIHNWNFHVAESPHGDAELVNLVQHFEQNAYLLCAFQSGPEPIPSSNLRLWLEKSEHPVCQQLIENLQFRRDSIVREIFGYQWGDPSQHISDLFTTMDKNRWCRAIVLETLGSRHGRVITSWAVSQFLDDDMGSCIQRFSDSGLVGYDKDEIRWSQAILSMLRKTTLIEEVCLTHPITPALADNVLGILRQMRDLRRADLRLSCSSMATHDILLSVGSWPRLQNLRLDGYGQPILGDRQHDRPGFDGGTPHPVYNLQSLSLKSVDILGPQLRFLTMSSHSSLRIVDLLWITTISNADFREWLLEIGPSLESFGVHECNFPRKHHNEEHAIDAAIHVMCALQRAYFSGDVASALVIERKVRRGNSACECSLKYSPSVDGPGLIRALGRTGFTTTDVPGRVFKGILKEEAIKIADGRGIELCFNYSLSG